MESIEHKELEEWARVFGGTAILGFISTLLLGGKFIHYILQRRGLVMGMFIIPPAMLSGLLGLVWFIGMEFIDPIMTADLRMGLEALKGNLINFVFASLILGITCSRVNSQHTTSWRGIITSLFHEGMPMIIYSQILIWGQSTCSLLLLCVSNTFFKVEMDQHFSVIVPLALEAGGDVIVSSQYKQAMWSDVIAEESESLGTLAVSIIGIILFTIKPYLIAKGWLGNSYLREYQQTGGAPIHTGGTGQAEAFRRAPQKLPLHGGLTNRNSRASSTYTVPNSDGIAMNNRQMALDDIGLRPHSASNDFNINDEDDNSELQQGDSLYGNALSDNDSNERFDYDFRMDKDDINKYGQASLGAHIALIALTAFMSFGVALSLHLLEIEFKIDHHLLSGVRMFKLAMCCAMLCMQNILLRSNIKFNRDWFMRMCGLMLDLLIIAALSKAYPKPRALESKTHYLVCTLFLLVCILWNIFSFIFIARQMFPNYWYERAATLMGDTLGHSYTGLLFIRTLDPDMESPVPAAYAYKLMLFFIPSSGAKHTIVSTALVKHGPWAAFTLCLCVVFAWLVIFDTYFRHRFVSGTSNAKDRDRGNGDESNEPLLGDSGINESNNNLSELEMRSNILEKKQTTSQSTRSTTALLISGGNSLSPGRTSMSLGDIGAALISNNSTKARDGDRDGDTSSTTVGLYRMATVPVQSSEPSSIISAQQMSVIAGFLSESKMAGWRLSYSLRQHGASLSTLLALNTKKNRSGRTSISPSIILIEDSWGYIFGGFISPSIQDRTSYYGNGESFVFSIVPTPQVYKWTGKNNLFVLSNERCFAMGGGNDGFAIQLDDELDTGVSNSSGTYDNCILSSSEFFKCLNVEVWVLDMIGFSV